MTTSAKIYDDGDVEDYYAHELLPLLLPTNKLREDIQATDHEQTQTLEIPESLARFVRTPFTMRSISWRSSPTDH